MSKNVGPHRLDATAPRSPISSPSPSYSVKYPQSSTMEESDTQSRKPFVYDPPQPKLMRLFLLDQNGDDEPLSGKLLSFLSYEAEVTTSLYAGFASHRHNRKNSETWKVMEALTGSYSYVALSYSWGNTPERHPLYTTTIHNQLDPSKGSKTFTVEQRLVMDQDTDRNGYLYITTSLQEFLLEQRRRRVNKFLWIDAICIDQSKADDKSNQIPLMRRYYEASVQVNVWLGTGTTLERGAMKILPRMVEILCQDFHSDEQLDQGKDGIHVEGKNLKILKGCNRD
jgi:hypothetical protein